MIQAAPMQNGEEIQENASGAAFLNLQHVHYQSRFRHVIVQYPPTDWSLVNYSICM